MSPAKIYIAGLILIAALCSCVKSEKPNVVFILADDLGYGDLSCYGQSLFSTPHIDRLAGQGMLFTQHYSGSTVCAPSRSSLMTGLHTGHTPIRGNKELPGQEGQIPLPSDALTIAELFKEQGYTTGAFGKWGLGFVQSEGDPLNQGFDQFYGYNCQRMAHRYFPSYLWDNQDKDSLEGNNWIDKVTYAPDVIQERTLTFIEQNKDKPFFAYVPLILPHAELVVPDDSIFDNYDGLFEEGKPFPESERYSSDYGPDIVQQQYAPQEKPHAVYASMVQRIDVYVGQILQKLKELDLEDNTIVIFTSDNGPALEGGADPDFFDSNGALRATSETCTKEEFASLLSSNGLV